MSILTAIILSCILIVRLLLEHLSRSLKNDTTKFGRTLSHVCEIVGEFLFVIVTGIVLHDLFDRLF